MSIEKGSRISPLEESLTVVAVGVYLHDIRELSVKWVKETFPALPNPFAIPTDPNSFRGLNLVYDGMKVAAMDICTIEMITASKDTKDLFRTLRDINLSEGAYYLLRSKYLSEYFDGGRPLIDHLIHVDDSMREKFKTFDEPEYLKGRDRVLDYCSRKFKQSGYHRIIFTDPTIAPRAPALSA